VSDPAEPTRPPVPRLPEFPPADAPASAPAAPPVPPAQTWAPPSTPPFGAPAGRASTGTAPSDPADAGSPHPRARYAPPPGYAGLTPVYGGTPAAAHGTSRLGVVALLAAIAAAVGAPIVAGIAAYNVGLGAGREIALRSLMTDFDWSVLTPVREWVLAGELAFWAGTALGLWALIQGIIAIVRNRGRGAGIAAVVIAALGPILFGLAVQLSIGAGLAAGRGIGG